MFSCFLWFLKILQRWDRCLPLLKQKIVQVGPQLNSIDDGIDSQERNTKTVLLLGTSNSGKTTILKELIYWNKGNKYDILNNIANDIIDWLLYCVDSCEKYTNDWMLLMEQDIELLRELKKSGTRWYKHKNPFTNYLNKKRNIMFI